MRTALLAIGLATGCFSKPEFTGGTTSDRYGVLAVGALHACALGSAGELYCWGDNEVGQVGVAAPSSVVSPTRVGGDGAWSTISAGGRHTCGLRDGGVLCWGNNSSGQVQGGTGSSTSTPTVPSFKGTRPAMFSKITAGGNHSCAIGEGQLWCWGNFASIGLPAQVSQAQQIGSRTDWDAISAGANHVCGIANGEVLCFGDNAAGQTGEQGVPSVMVPTPVTFPVALVPIAIATGQDNSCAILGTRGAASGQLWCWGSNSGDPFTEQGGGITPPIRVGADATWSRITLGRGIACGIRDGRGACFGSATNGGLADGLWQSTQVSADEATDLGAMDAIALGLPADALAWDEGGCLALDGAVSCWGGNSQGRLGDGHRTTQPQPVEVAAPQGLSWRAVWAGPQHTCGKASDEQLYCWGANHFAQVTGDIGRGSQQPCVSGEPCVVSTPRRAPAMIDTPQAVIAANDFTCARQGPSVICWGASGNGEIGDPTPTGFAPYTVGAYTLLLGGPRAVCGANVGTGLYCWGLVPGRATPLLPAGMISMTEFAALGVGDDFACGKDAQNKRVCWGENAFGQLGIGSTNPSTGELTIGGIDINTIAVNRRHVCQIESSGGNLKCWGDNALGQVGISSSTPVVTSPSPVRNVNQVDLTECTDLAVGPTAVCAVCANRPYCWGHAGANLLGRPSNDTTDTHVAVPPALPDVSFVHMAVGEGHACAVSATDQLYCWGTGDRGQIGDGGHAANLPQPLGARL